MAATVWRLQEMPKVIETERLTISVSLLLEREKPERERERDVYHFGIRAGRDALNMRSLWNKQLICT